MPAEIEEKETSLLRAAVGQMAALLARQPRVLIAGGIVMLVILGGLIYLPPLKAIQRYSAQSRQLEADRVRSRQVIDQVRRGKAPLLRSPDAVPEILAELNTMARSYKIQFLSTTPGTLEQNQLTKMVILPVDLQVEGEYRALGEFLGALRRAASLGVVYVRQFSLSRDDRLLPRMRVGLSIGLALDQGSSL